MLWKPLVTLLCRGPGMQWKPRVDVLLGPGPAQPGMFRVVDDPPGPFGAGACHYVEVVHVIPGRGHGRTVVAVRNQHDVTTADLFEHLDRALRVAVHAVIAEAA